MTLPDGKEEANTNRIGPTLFSHNFPPDNYHTNVIFISHFTKELLGYPPLFLKKTSLITLFLYFQTDAQVHISFFSMAEEMKDAFE